MEETASEGFAEAWQCCQAIKEIDPAAGQACFAELKDWRAELTWLIVEWYQACLDGNQSLAQSLLRSMRQLFVQGMGECGPVRPDSLGGFRTAGLPFTTSDVISIDAAFQSLGSPGSSGVFGLAGRLQARIAGAELEGSIEGHLVLPSGPGEGEDALDPQAIEDLSILCRFGTETLVLRMAGATPENRLVWSKSGARIEARLRVRASEELSILLPSEVWISWPIDGALAGDRTPSLWMPLRSFLPPALGFADWDRDGVLSIADRDAFYGTPDQDRDLNLDGEGDDEDERIFERSWRRWMSD